MKETRIPYSLPMARARRAGLKTMTRRVVKPQPFQTPIAEVGVGESWNWVTPKATLANWITASKFTAEVAHFCPYGQPGDRLWVREAWAEVPRAEPRTDEDLPWRPDGRIVVYKAQPEWEGARTFLCADGALRWVKPSRWRPSIHMPRWASRITLEITGVRVERLQDISEADAMAEGIGRYDNGTFGLDYPGACMGLTAAVAYRRLWQSINGDGSWEANPYVWVVEFKVVT